MENKIQKAKGKIGVKHVSVRIRLGSKKVAVGLLAEANNKKRGRKIKLDELVELALGLVTSEHLKRLQEDSMTNEDRKEILRQKYIEMRGPISKDEFTGFMMSQDFAGFVAEQGGLTLAASA